MTSPTRTWLPIGTDVLCELAHELTVRECAIRGIALDANDDDETIYSCEAQLVFLGVYDIAVRVLERLAEVQS